MEKRYTRQQRRRKLYKLAWLMNKQNKQLVAEIDELRRQVDTLAEEKQMILKEKEKIERAMINSIIGEDSKPDKLLSKAKPKQSRWRYLLRPWALFKRQS